MGILRRFFKSVVRKNTKENETYKTPCNPNAHWDRKQCKSCKFFIPKRYTCLCEEGGTVSPLQKACKNYVKRKINARDLVYGK